MRRFDFVGRSTVFSCSLERDIQLNVYSGLPCLDWDSKLEIIGRVTRAQTTRPYTCRISSIKFWTNFVNTDFISVHNFMCFKYLCKLQICYPSICEVLLLTSIAAIHGLISSFLLCNIRTKVSNMNKNAKCDFSA